MSENGPADAPRPRVVQLADQLGAEIRTRGLQPGDRFLTAAEAARSLSVSMTLANRALQLLAQRGVIERRRRLGAVVAEAREASARRLSRVAVLAPEADVVREGLLEDGVIVGLQRSLPGCEISFHATSRDHDVDALRQSLGELGAVREPVGVVLVRSSLAVQRLAVRRGMPTVVFGTPRPSIRELDAVDRDHASAGRQLAERVCGRSARLLVLMHEHVLPGDQLFLDGIAEASAGSTATSSPRPIRVHTRFCPTDQAAVAATIEDHLEWIGDRRVRVAVVCRSLPLAQTARRHLQRQGRAHRIGVADVYGARVGTDLHVAVPTEGAERQGELIGEMLQRRAAEPSAQPQRRWIAVHVTP